MLASRVRLSPSRLARLFRLRTGVAIRRYVIWARLRAVIEYRCEGMTLTRAALEAGFSDAAHMTNSYRRMFGFAPSALFVDGVEGTVVASS